MASVTISIVDGPTKTPYTLTAENGDIRELLAAVRDEIPNLVDRTVLVNGDEATEDTVLAEGDEVAFNKPAGQKG